MSESEETLGSSNISAGHSFLIFGIRHIEAETKFQISCLNRRSFKKTYILKDAKQFDSTVPFTALGFQ